MKKIIVTSVVKWCQIHSVAFCLFVLESVKLCVEKVKKKKIFLTFRSLQSSNVIFFFFTISFSSPNGFD